MHSVVDRIRQYSHWLVLFVLEGISLYLVLSFNLYQKSVWFTAANTVCGAVLKVEEELLAYLRLGGENAELMSRNIILQHQNDLLRSEIARLSHDSTYTERLLTERISGLGLVRACVVDNTVMLRDNYLVLDKGLSDGVREEMGVVSGTGIVGIVSQVTEHKALVMSILNSKSSISCRIRGSEYFGYLRWYGGNTICASLDDVPRHARFKLGDAVETSGFSNVFPPGIYVGKVIKVRDSKDGLSYQLIVQLSTDMANLSNATVILNENDTIGFQ